jgi:hypothetical protein
MMLNRAGHRIWTPADDDLLRAGWASGKPVSAIAAGMGITKNAAMGRLHRLKLEARPSPIKRARLSSAFEQAAAAERRARQPKTSPLFAASAMSEPGAPNGSGSMGVTSLNFPALPECPPLGGVGVLFGEARSTQCAFPLWPSNPRDAVGLAVGDRIARDKYVCGQPTARRTDGSLSPYCAGHHAICTKRPALAAAA